MSASETKAEPFAIAAATQVGGVHLVVGDLDRSLAFYAGGLGWRVVERSSEGTGLSASGLAPAQIRLTVQPGARPQPRRTSGLYHVALLHPDRRALARTVARLLSLDVPFQGASDHLVSEALYLADPDGHGIELYRDRPREEWPRRDGRLVMDTAPLDVDGLLEEARADAEAWTGADPATRIGHIHLRTADIPAAAAFYHDLLGFEEVMWYGRQALFLAADGYHHHIGLNTWSGVGAPPPPPDSVRLVSWSVALPTQEDLDRLLHRVRTLAPGRVLGGSPAVNGDGIRLRGPDEVEVHLVTEVA